MENSTTKLMKNMVNPDNNILILKQMSANNSMSMPLGFGKKQGFQNSPMINILLVNNHDTQLILISFR